MNYLFNQQKWYEMIALLPEPQFKISNFLWAENYARISQIKMRPIDKDAYCQARIWEIEDNSIILISQDNNNSSVSVTNACEYICTVIVNNLNLDVNKTRFYESYTYLDKPEFDEIKFAVSENHLLRNPSWRRSTNEFKSFFKRSR